MKTRITWFLVYAMCVMSLLTLLHPKNEIIEQENRKITPFPALPAWNKKSIRQFFHQVDMYYMDRLEFRDGLISLASHFPKQQDTQTCYEGKDNWLFLGNEYERTVDALTGKLTFDKNTLNRKTYIYRNIQQVVEKHGAEFHMMVGPNKSSMYPEFLPDMVIPAKQRFVQPLIASLQDAGVHVFDAQGVLAAKKSDALLYWRTDTHWNKYGSYLATEAFLQQAGLPFLPHCTGIEQEPPFRGGLVGTIGREDYPLSSGDNAMPVWDTPLETPICDKKALLIGDSFSELPYDYLKMVYPVVQRVHYLAIPRRPMEPFPDALDRYLDSLPFRPDIVLWIQVERFYAVFP